MNTKNKKVHLSDIKGKELLEDYADYVKTTAMEARAIVSVQSGSLQRSTVIRDEKDGFTIYASPSLLRYLSKEEDYYAYQYAKKGYPNWDPFPYIEVAAEQIARSPRYSVGDSGEWSAKYKGVKRNGAGSSDDKGLDNGKLQAFVNKSGMRVKIPKRLRK